MQQAIEEALRWETPLLTVARAATQDLELGGVSIPQGGFVAVSLGVANRDLRRYPDPIDRRHSRAYHQNYKNASAQSIGTPFL